MNKANLSLSEARLTLGYAERCNIKQVSSRIHLRDIQICRALTVWFNWTFPLLAILVMSKSI